MQTVTLPSPSTGLNDPELQRRVNALRATDNLTNWFYLAREYLFLAAAIGLSIYFFQARESWGLPWLWNVPVTLLAVLVIGVGQHRLLMLGHEASHYALFRNRLLNEVASDLFCMFSVLSTTHNYRMQHMPHHQYVNDPARDPDLVFMHGSGHHFEEVPITWRRFFWQYLVKQFCWVPALIRYMSIRARYAATGSSIVASGQAGPEKSRVFVRAGVLYLLTLVTSLTGLVIFGNTWALAVVPPCLLACVLTFYALLPERLYPRTSIKSDLPPRWRPFLRLPYLTTLFSTIAWLTHLTGHWWAIYYLVLWMVPLFTTYPFLMILREELQHGGAGRERFTHTRNFEGNFLVQFAVFPFGMDYHLPHHLFPMIPHYRLRQLHRLLMETDIYSQQATGMDVIFTN